VVDELTKRLAEAPLPEHSCRKRREGNNMGRGRGGEGEEDSEEDVDEEVR